MPRRKGYVEEFEWPARMHSLGQRWRDAWVTRGELPKEIVKSWGVLLDELNAVVAHIGKNRRLCKALLQICATADEASVGVGIPVSNPAVKAQGVALLDRFQAHADKLLLPRD